MNIAILIISIIGVALLAVAIAGLCIISRTLHRLYDNRIHDIVTAYNLISDRKFQWTSWAVTEEPQRSRRRHRKNRIDVVQPTNNVVEIK